MNEILAKSCQYDRITIGLFGQVGAGKSTLANRYIFLSVAVVICHFFSFETALSKLVQSSKFPRGEHEQSLTPGVFRRVRFAALAEFSRAFRI